jgi:hypothetical protein
MVVEIPEGFKMPQIDDGRSSVSGLGGEKRINLADRGNQVAGTFATMAHLEDSLNDD